MSDLNRMAGFAIATVALATVTLVGIAIINGFSQVQTGTEIVGNATVPTYAVDNATAQLFIAGLTVFGTFMSIITLALVGKIIINIVRE